MEDLMITTMPIKPYEKINIGLMVAPILCDVIGSILNCKKVLSVNLLHSFDDKQNDLKKYIDVIKSFNINYNEIIKDIDHTDKYLEKIEELYFKQIINIRNGKILRCDCGKVEMTKESIKYNKNGDLFYWNDGKIFCKCCNNECKEYTQKNLYLDIKPESCKKISVSPIFLQKDFNDLVNKFINADILISKNRQQEYFLTFEGQKFNIDIDMLWMMFNQIEESKNQILVASNHQLYEMLISNYINNIFENKNVHYIATPYLVNNEGIDFTQKIFSKESDRYKKLFVLYSLKWKYKTLNWNNGIIGLLNKLSEEDINKLYDVVVNIPFNKNCDIGQSVNEILSKLNINNNIKVLRR